MRFAGVPLALRILETLDFAARPSVNKVLIAELMSCECVDKKENILVGNPGTGQSHLATALAAQGYRVRFARTTELVTALIEARDERELPPSQGSARQAGPPGSRPMPTWGLCRAVGARGLTGLKSTGLLAVLGL
jgi:IstB-like ATP binding protein